MLIERRDFYRIKVNLKKSNISAVMEIEFILNQMNMNKDGDYYFKVKEIKQLDSGEQIQDPQRKQKIAELLVGIFNDSSTNFLGKTASEITLNY